MNYEVLQLEIRTALRLSPVQYRNEMRVSFEVWAFKTAQLQNVLLEKITRCERIWKWYQLKFQVVEKRFHKENYEFLDGTFDPMELFQVFRWMTAELEEIYPQTLINNLQHEHID